MSDLVLGFRKFRRDGLPDNPAVDKEAAEKAAAAARAPINEAEVKLGRLIWTHILATGEVSVGRRGEWNHLTFDELISIPEEEIKDGGGTIQGLSARQPPAALESKPKKLPKARPRLFVGESIVWNTLTGHGQDFKRVPMMEWRLLVVIGSTKEDGILQGDLVRATGQDKRSVPKRTDFLTQKGYIAKRTHMVRGSKTSKLWLAKFAPELPAPSNPLKGLDMSPELLTKDMEAVPWCHLWVDNKGASGKDEIHYTALAQTIVAIIKAWGTLRTRDLKKKLGIEGRKWQMKVMSKFLRRFDLQGNMAYVAATFPGNNFVFKDCVKFLRELTQEDWRSLLATGKRPSPNRGRKSRAKGKKSKGKATIGRPRKFPLPPKPTDRPLKKSHRNPPRPLRSLWEPEKPVANAIAELILTGGKEGYTTPEISSAVAGPEWSRYMFTHLNDNCVPDLQPEGLQEYQMSSELTRSGKTKATTFTCAGLPKLDHGQNSQEELVIDPALAGNDGNAAQSSESQAIDDPFNFASVDAKAFAFEEGTSDLTDLCAITPTKQARNKRPYRRRQVTAVSMDDPAEDVETVDIEENATESPRPAKRRKPKMTQPAEDVKADSADVVDAVNAADASGTRPKRRRKAAQRVSYLDTFDGDTDDAATGAVEESARKRPATDRTSYAESPELDSQSGETSGGEEDRSQPGVYVGIPGSLKPAPQKKGRPKKSIVLIFRSDKIKDPNYLPGWADYPKPRVDTQPATSIQKPSKALPTPSVPKGKQPAPMQSGVQGQPELEVQVQISESGHPKDIPNLEPMQITQQAEEGTIVVKSFSVLNKSQETQGQPPVSVVPVAAIQDASSPANNVAPSIGATPTQVSKAPRRRGRLSAKPPQESWICEKCGGSWMGENGLQYHLTMGKNMCNPRYAEDPEGMARKKPGRPARDANSTPELADPGSPESDVSISSTPSLEETPARPRAKKVITPKKVPKKKSNNIPVRIDPNDSNDHANQRPVLKPRSILKNRHLGVGGSGIIPRGVEASEAVAKEAAAARPAKVLEDTKASSADLLVVDGKNQVASVQEEDDEDLPYLEHIRPKAVKSVTLPKSILSRSNRRISAEADQARNKGSPKHRGTEMQTTPSEATPEVSQIDSAYPEPSTGTIEASNAFSPYPAEVLQLASPASAIKGRTARKSLPGQRPDSSAESKIKLTPPFNMIMDAPAANDHNGEEKLKPVRTHIMEEIVEYVVKSSGGVFPTDRALHWAVLKVYLATISYPPYPTLSGCSRAVARLAKDGVLKIGAVALRANGRWKSLNLAMLPDMDVNHQAVEDFKARVREADLEMYLPPPFNPTESEKIRIQELEKPSRTRGKGPGRRDHKLAEGIAELTAPYYAQTGMAGVRPGYKGRRGLESSDEDDEHLDKGLRSNTARGAHGEFAVIRRRRKRKGDENIDSPPAKKGRRGRKRLSDDYEDFILEPHKLSINGTHAANPGISSLPASFFSGVTIPSTSNYSAPTEVQFLAPNTQLEDDYVPEPRPQPEPEISAPTPSNVSVQEEEEEPELFVEPGTHADTIELCAVKGQQGVWPVIPAKWFEENPASFTMKGWLPGANDQLMENIPKTMEQMAFKITSHCKVDQWADPNYGVFCTSVDGCKAYELSVQGTRALSGCIAPDYLFMDLSPVPAVSNMAPVDPQWLDENEWTLETIPYEMLETDDEDLTLKPSVIIPETHRQKRGPGRPRTKQSPPPKRKYRRRGNQDPNVRELKLQRELTAYPLEAAEYFRVKGQDCLGVDWKAEDTRIAAYVAVSTLTGGINKAMDWGLMMRIFPESKLSNLRKFWSMIKKEREGFIHDLSAKFQDEFLVAYENGDLPPFDFDNPLDYDWLRLVKWTLALVVREGIDLPPTRKLFDEKLELVHVDKNDFDWRETYHHWQRSVFNKFQDSTSEPASMPLDAKQKMEDNDVIVARSWVRALCCTEPDQYTPYQIRDKFLTLSRGGKRSEQEISNLLEVTIFDLEHRRIAIKQKATALATGRPYKLNDHFSRTLDRHSNEDKFAVAADFKLKLDAAFRQNPKEAVEIPWRTEDGMVIAAFNMQAAGRVIIEPVKRLDIPFGFKPGFYESRKFPKSYYRFDLQIRATPAYLYNEQIEVLHRATVPDNIPAETADGKLPMWCDFFGRPDRRRWFKMLGGVLFVLATRGAMTDEYAAQALKPCFERFEVETVRKWGLAQGLLREITVPGGAVTVTEWWWLIVGNPMLEMASAAAAAAAATAADAAPATAADAAATAAANADAGTADLAKEGEGKGHELENSGRRTRDQYAEWASGRSRRRGKYRVIH